MKRKFAALNLFLLLTFASTTISCSSNTQNETPSLVINNGESITLKTGESIKLDITKKHLTGDVAFSTSNNEVVIVNTEGVVKAIKHGEAIITVSSGKTKDTIKVIVEPTYELQIIDKMLTIPLGQGMQILAETRPFNETPTFKSENELIATVSSNGYVTAKKVGTTRIEVSYKGIVEYVEIKVYELEQSLTILGPKEITIAVGTTYEISVENKNLSAPLEYISSNNKIASVDASAIIIAIAPGTCTITVKSGNVKDTMTVHVIGITPQIIINDQGPLKLTVNQVHTLSITKKDFYGDVEFISSNNKIATVNNKGEIHAIDEGEAIITVKYQTAKSSIKVIVTRDKITSLSISVPKNNITIGENIYIVNTYEPIVANPKIEYILTGDTHCISLENSAIRGVASGTVKIQASSQGLLSNIIEINVVAFNISVPKTDFMIGEKAQIEVNYFLDLSALKWFVEDANIILITKDANNFFYINALKPGSTSFYFLDQNNNKTNVINVTVLGGNPYLNVNKDEFYKNYTVAKDAQDAKFRTEVNLMSGKLDEQDQKPTESTSKPVDGANLIHNSTTYFINSDTYEVHDSKGTPKFKVYKGGAYTTLEEVAAYIYAFGDVPANYHPDRKNYPRPTQSPWGKYLRLNNSYFNGDVNRFPHEPILPDISGCGGNLKYYEVDIGTTGTDCDPKYPIKPYNDGTRITRGAARIVYSREYLSTLKPVSMKDRYVFYTYNHYNDFQEYLNYENGWGKMFGNVSAGNALNQSGAVKPTAVPPTSRKPIN